MDQTNFDLDPKYIGVLPIVNHFLERLKFKEELEKYPPPADERSRITLNQALGLLVRNIIVCRTPPLFSGRVGQAGGDGPETAWLEAQSDRAA